MDSMDGRRGCAGARLGLAAIVAIISVVSYYATTSKNAITGEKQHISISPSQEIALGLQATPEMIQEFGGEESSSADSERVQSIGALVVKQSDAGSTPYKFQFHLLGDRQTINAFALPGGQVFITRALLDRLKTDGQLAGVLGHEVGHVCARHSAEHIAKAKLTQGLTGAAVLATYDPYDRNSGNKAAVAIMIGQLVNLKFSRDDELEADELGVRFMSEAGYDPRSMIDVMKILKEASGGGGSDFFKTHPNPDQRVERIENAIKERFPSGVPDHLKR